MKLNATEEEILQSLKEIINTLKKDAQNQELVEELNEVYEKIESCLREGKENESIKEAVDYAILILKLLFS